MGSNLALKQDNSPIARLKRALDSDSVQRQFQNALKENSNLFCASLIDLYASDKYLQECEPKDVIMEALKAATLKLPINKALGFYYIVPFRNNKLQKVIPTGIIGYKGFLQLAQRTGQYRYINADAIFEGEHVEVDRLTGEVFFSDQATSEKAIGYFAHIEMISGFRKTTFWSIEQVERHAKRYSKSYHKSNSPWKTEFDSMAIKTVLRHLLTRYGVMSVDMINAISYDSADFQDQAQQQKSLPKPTGVSYDVTAQAPERPKAPEPDTGPPDDEPPTEKTAQDEQKDESNPDQPIDEFGTPIDSPFEKSKWFHQRAGSPKDGTGFGGYVMANVEHLSTASSVAYNVMFEKWKKLYNQSFPYRPDGNPIEIQYGKGPVDPEAPEPPIETESGDVEKDEVNDDSGIPLLETNAAKLLASMAGKHKREYLMVVRNRAPESIEQIYSWIDEINQLVVKHVKEQGAGADSENF